MGAGPGQDWSATGPRGHVVPRRAALGAGRDSSGKLSDVAAAPSPAGATSAWRPKGASSGALQAFPKPPIQGQRRSRRIDLTSYCVPKCRCFPLANVDGPLQRSVAPRDRPTRPSLGCTRTCITRSTLAEFARSCRHSVPSHSRICSSIFASPTGVREMSVAAREDITSASPDTMRVTMPSCASAAVFAARLLVSTAIATVWGIPANACWLASARSKVAAQVAVGWIRIFIGLVCHSRSG